MIKSKQNSGHRPMTTATGAHSDHTKDTTVGSTRTSCSTSTETEGNTKEPRKPRRSSSSSKKKKQMGLKQPSTPAPATSSSTSSATGRSSLRHRKPPITRRSVPRWSHIEDEDDNEQGSSPQSPPVAVAVTVAAAASSQRDSVKHTIPLDDGVNKKIGDLVDEDDDDHDDDDSKRPDSTASCRGFLLRTMVDRPSQSLKSFKELVVGYSAKRRSSARLALPDFECLHDEEGEEATEEDYPSINSYLYESYNLGESEEESLFSSLHEACQLGEDGSPRTVIGLIGNRMSVRTIKALKSPCQSKINFQVLNDEGDENASSLPEGKNTGALTNQNQDLELDSKIVLGDFTLPLQSPSQSRRKFKVLYDEGDEDDSQAKDHDAGPPATNHKRDSASKIVLGDFTLPLQSPSQSRRKFKVLYDEGGEDEDKHKAQGKDDNFAPSNNKVESISKMDLGAFTTPLHQDTEEEENANDTTNRFGCETEDHADEEPSSDQVPAHEENQECQKTQQLCVADILADDESQQDPTYCSRLLDGPVTEASHPAIPGLGGASSMARSINSPCRRRRRGSGRRENGQGRKSRPSTPRRASRSAGGSCNQSDLPKAHHLIDNPHDRTAHSVFTGHDGLRSTLLSKSTPHDLKDHMGTLSSSEENNIEKKEILTKKDPVVHGSKKRAPHGNVSVKALVDIGSEIPADTKGDNQNESSVSTAATPSESPSTSQCNSSSRHRSHRPHHQARKHKSSSRKTKNQTLRRKSCPSVISKAIGAGTSPLSLPRGDPGDTYFQELIKILSSPSPPALAQLVGDKEEARMLSSIDRPLVLDDDDNNGKHSEPSEADSIESQATKVLQDKDYDEEGKFYCSDFS